MNPKVSGSLLESPKKKPARKAATLRAGWLA
jgi:hypothetical protein